MPDFYVYAFLSKTDNTTVRYIGKGQGQRMYANNRTYKVPRENRVKVIGGLTEEEAYWYEKQLIAFHGRLDLKTGTLVNHTDGGEGLAGASPEWRAEHSARMTGEGNSFYGKTHTQETKDQIIQSRKENEWKKKFKPLSERPQESLKAKLKRERYRRENPGRSFDASKRNGRTWSKEEREEVSRRMKGKKVSAETRALLSAQRKGKPGHKHTEEHKAKVAEWNQTRVLKPSNKYFAALGQGKRWEVVSPEGKTLSVLTPVLWCKDQGLSAESMRLVANGKQKAGHHKGWTCKFI